MAKAKELIRAAHLSGADMVKGQIFDPLRMEGSMPSEFYQQCCFDNSELCHLQRYADGLGIYYFNSFFHAREDLEARQIVKKISASQCVDIYTKYKKIKNYEIDNPSTLISVPESCAFPDLKKAIPMHVTDYLSTNPKLDRIEIMKWHYTSRRNMPAKIGYSDHTEGIENCYLAGKYFGADIIEKHLTLNHNERWNGQIFRDTVHGATPKQFQILARRLK